MARVEEINIDIAKVIFSCRLLVFWNIPKYRNQNYGVKNQNQELKKKIKNQELKIPEVGYDGVQYRRVDPVKFWFID